MFQRKRGDTKASTIERTYGIDLNIRGDAKIGNVLRRRGFDSVSQLVKAHKLMVTSPTKKRRLFLSFHAEDRPQVDGLRLMAKNPMLPLDFYDGSVRQPVESEESSYIKRIIEGKIAAASVVVCLIGNRTAWRDWVEWELETGLRLGKGLCGVRLKGARGRAPALLHEIGAPIAGWKLEGIVAAIEAAAARRG